MSAFWSKYGVARHLYIPMVKRAVVDFAVSADWTPAAGDVKISKDGGAAANVTNLPTAITMGNTAMWDFSLTATEMQAAQVMVTVADSATKAVEDTMFIIATHGNASAQFQIDLADAVRAGLTALPNANAEAAGGLYTRGTGAGQINQPANGLVDTNTVRWAGAVVATPDTAGYPKVTLKTGTGTGEITLTTGEPSARLSTQGKADVNAEVVDTLNIDTYAEIGQEAPAATQTLRKMLAFLYKAFRNKIEQDATTMKIYNDAGSTVDQKATVSDSGTLYTRGEIGTGP